MLAAYGRSGPSRSGLLAVVATALMLSILSGCAEDATSPRSSLTGYVTVVGELRDVDGNSLVLQRSTDVDGLVVYLRLSDSVVDTTYTLGGGYAFHDLSPGVYQAMLSVAIRLAPISVQAILAEESTVSVAFVDLKQEISCDVIAPDTSLTAGVHTLSARSRITSHITREQSSSSSPGVGCGVPVRSLPFAGR
jgi:hypothetical protein